jgi:hypothetical protein
MLDQFIVELFPLLHTIAYIGFVSYLARNHTETAVLLTIAAILVMLFRPSDQLHYNAPPTTWLRVHRGLVADGCWSLAAVVLMSIGLYARSRLTTMRNPPSGLNEHSGG